MGDAFDWEYHIARIDRRIQRAAHISQARDVPEIEAVVEAAGAVYRHYVQEGDVDGIPYDLMSKLGDALAAIGAQEE